MNITRITYKYIKSSIINKNITFIQHTNRKVNETKYKNSKIETEKRNERKNGNVKSVQENEIKNNKERSEKKKLTQK